jgi:hypothetical protein
MKKKLFPALFVLAALVAAAPARTYNEKWDATLGPAKTQKLKWFQAETIELNLTAKNGDTTLDLTDTNAVVTWEITGWNDTTNVYAATVGLITDAENGVCEFELTPEESNLPIGTYRGYVRAFIQDGTEIEDIGVLCYQNIKVYFAPDGRLFNWEGPYTWAPFDSSLTNSIYAGIATNAADILDNASDITDLQSSLVTTSNSLASGYASADAALQTQVTDNDADITSLQTDLTTASNTLAAADASLQLQVTENNTNISALTADQGLYADCPINPVLGYQYYATDDELDLWIKWDGSEWKTLTGVSVDDLF